METPIQAEQVIEQAVEKLCKNCQHCKINYYYDNEPNRYICRAPQNLTGAISLIDGTPLYTYDILTMRYSDFMCGVEGKFYLENPHKVYNNNGMQREVASTTASSKKYKEKFVSLEDLM